MIFSTKTTTGTQKEKRGPLQVKEQTNEKVARGTPKTKEKKQLPPTNAKSRVRGRRCNCQASNKQ